MMQDDFDFLPIFSFPTYVSYYCPDGLVTDNFEEAKAHGYGTVGNRSASFGHRDAFETFDHSVLPVITGICMTLERLGGGYLLEYYIEEKEKFFAHEVWYNSKNIENGKLKPLVGTAQNPYNYIDQGEDIYIFERDGYVMVLSAMNWEAYSDMFTGFKVKKEEFYEAFSKMDFPIPRS